MSDPCPLCGKDRALVGYRHLCAPPVTKPVIVTPPVTHSVAVQAENDRLRKELVQLKRELAELERGKPKPKSNAERQRNFRARRKAKA